MYEYIDTITDKNNLKNLLVEFELKHKSIYVTIKSCKSIV